MNRQLVLVVARTIAVSFLLFGMPVTLKEISSAQCRLSIPQGVGSALLLSIAAVLPGIAVGVSLYSAHRRITVLLDSSVIRHLTRWVAMLGGGVVGALIAGQVGSLYIANRYPVDDLEAI